MTTESINHVNYYKKKEVKVEEEIVEKVEEKVEAKPETPIEEKKEKPKAEKKWKIIKIRKNKK